MSTVRRRSAPLRVEHDGSGSPSDAPAGTPAGSAPDVDEYGIAHVVSSRTRTDEDRRSFAAAVRDLRTGGGSLNLSERTLMVVGGIIAPLGLLFVLLGWVGASRTPNLFEQVPYLISGGLFGLALVFLGAFFYFAHWITELVKEGRAQSAALLEAIERLQDEVRSNTAPGAEVTPTEHHNGSVGVLVATARGSMVHRSDCVVVEGKSGVHTVEDAGDFAPCKLCEPFAIDA